MEEVVMAVISLIILVPIIYFLPLGLSNKGKGSIILVAFAFANLGLLAKNTFPLLHTGLIILFLAIITVYILEKRFSKLLFIESVSEEKLSDLSSNVSDEPIINNQTDEINSERIELRHFDEVELRLDNQSFEPEIQAIAMIEGNKKIKLEVDSSSSSRDKMEELVDEVSFLLEREEIEEVTTSSLQGEDVQLENYISSIEELIEEVDADASSTLAESAIYEESIENLQIGGAINSSDKNTIEVLPTLQDVEDNNVELEEWNGSIILPNDALLVLDELRPNKDGINDWLLNSDLDLEDDISFENLNDLEAAQFEASAGLNIYADELDNFNLNTEEADELLALYEDVSLEHYESNDNDREDASSRKFEKDNKSLLEDNLDGREVCPNPADIPSEIKGNIPVNMMMKK